MPAPIDPWLSLVIGALGASVIGGLAALLTAWIQGRREHQKWLRERRFDHYRAFMIDMDSAQRLIADAHGLGTPSLSMLKEAKEIQQRLRNYKASVTDAFEAVSLLGPRRVNKAGQDWAHALSMFAKECESDESKERMRMARWTFLVVAGKVLRSGNVTKFPPRAPEDPQSPTNDASV